LKSRAGRLLWTNNSQKGILVGAYSLAQAKDQLSRLVDEALEGEIVTITRDGKAVVSLTPMARAPLPLTKDDIDEMRRRAEARPLGADSVTLIREMRDEEP
jgi:antitoxin (DNA-binding transcriptional repressor) of toxin-antitoxin stability system